MPISSLIKTFSVVGAALLLGAALAGCDSGQPQAAGSQPQPPQVSVAKPAKRMVAEKDEYVGRFAAIDAIEIRARVSGYLATVHFTDGQLVKKGDLLFTIDRRPFEAALAQAQAAVAQAEANLAFTTADLDRGTNLARGNVISQQTLDQRIQAKRVAEANVAAQKAAVRQAALDLEFTELRAPASGRIGDRRVAPGNLVTGGTTGTTTLLATITSIDPIWFEFTMDETSYLRYMRLAAASGQERGFNVPVRLKLIDEPGFSHYGKTDFIDNAIDRATGTIRGRALFANPNGTFTPGMFARVEVEVGAAAEVLLVPDVAVGTEQVRKFVLVVDGENVARAKYVTLGAVIDGLRVVTAGLDPGDRVVVNGLMRARNGVKVTPVETVVDAAASEFSAGAKATAN